jgi:hypothetical protein
LTSSENAVSFLDDIINQEFLSQRTAQIGWHPNFLEWSDDWRLFFILSTTFESSIIQEQSCYWGQCYDVFQMYYQTLTLVVC